MRRSCSICSVNLAQDMFVLEEIGKQAFGSRHLAQGIWPWLETFYPNHLNSVWAWVPGPCCYMNKTMGWIIITQTLGASKTLKPPVLMTQTLWISCVGVLYLGIGVFHQWAPARAPLILGSG
jgi:hypothetical protein